MTFRSQGKSRCGANPTTRRFVRAPAELETFRSLVMGTKFTSINAHLSSKQSWSDARAASPLLRSTRLRNGSKLLAEGTSGKSRDEAYGEWGARLLKRFKVPKREALLSTDMPDVEAWYRQQKAIQTTGYKTKAPDQWRASRIRAIKSAMRSMGKSNETYYPELSDRLNMKKPFTSLTRLTKTDLDRAYQMVLRDSRRSGND